jgi:AcrR family transcriptional regulator
VADATLELIADRGLGSFTAASLARAIGVTDAALFHHFRGMDDIVMAAIERVGELLFARFPPADADPLARLGRFFRDRVAAQRSSPGAVRLILSDQLAQVASQAGARRVAEYRKRSIGFIRGCLEEAEEAGRLAAGLGSEEATVLVLGALMVLTQASGLVAPGGDVEVLAEKVWARLEKVLAAGAIPAPAKRGSRKRKEKTR